MAKKSTNYIGEFEELLLTLGRGGRANLSA